MIAKAGNRGLALILVLLVTVLLIMLTGAFLGVNRSNMSMLAIFINREAGFQACMSAMNYVWMRLESDATWSTAAFPDPGLEYYHPSTQPYRLKIREKGNGSEPEENLVEGEILGTDMSFTVKIINNIANDTPILDEAVPARSARLRITGISGPISRRAEVVFRKAHFVDSSAISNDDMNIDLDTVNSANPLWQIRSKDPYRNLVRSNRNITGPDAVRANQIRFFMPEGSPPTQPAPYGTAWAVGDILLGGRSLSSGEEKEAWLAAAEQSSMGTFVPKGAPKYKIPDILPRNITLPPDNTNIQPGEYVFTYANLSIEELTYIDGDAVWVDAGSVRANALKRVQGGVQDLWYEEPPVGGNRRISGVSPEAAHVHKVNNMFRIEDGSSTAFYVDLRNAMLASSVESKVTVNGTFELSSDREGTTPVLFVGSLPKVGKVGKTPGAIVSTSGDVNIKGTVVGYGSLIADTGSISIYAKSAMSTSPDRGIALYAGNNISIEKDPNLKMAKSNQQSSMLPSDWEAYKEALQHCDKKNEMDAWQVLTEEQREPLIGKDDTSGGGYRNAVLDDAARFWAILSENFPPDDAAREAYRSWTSRQKGSMTLGQYIRLREYLKSADAKKPDSSWLNLSERNDEAGQIIYNQLTMYANDAGQVRDEKKCTYRPRTLSEFFSQKTNPYLLGFYPDMSFRGLIYSRNGDFRFNASQKGISIEGAVVARNGSINIREATGVNFIYNPLFLDTMLENVFAPGVKLEKVLCYIY